MSFSANRGGLPGSCLRGGQALIRTLRSSVWPEVLVYRCVLKNTSLFCFRSLWFCSSWSVICECDLWHHLPSAELQLIPVNHKHDLLELFWEVGAFFFFFLTRRFCLSWLANIQVGGSAAGANMTSAFSQSECVCRLLKLYFGLVRNSVSAFQHLSQLCFSAQPWGPRLSPLPWWWRVWWWCRRAWNRRKISTCRR